MRIAVTLFLAATLVADLAVVDGFSVVVGPKVGVGAARLATRFMSDDGGNDDAFPSDTSSDGVMTVESEPFEPSESESLITSVMDQLPGIGEVSAETRATINEALLKLEALNPTKDPANSPLINGVWELRYAAGYTAEWTLPSPTRQLALFLYSGGYSPALFALSLAQKLPSNIVELGDLEISIARESPRVEATVPLKLFGGMQNNVVVKAQLDVVSGRRLQETYESATVMDRTVSLPQQVRYSRDLYVTYVDNDLLIVRDGSGVPEVLVRKEKTFRANWGNEP